MEKALHDDERAFFSFKNGELLVWHPHDVEMLLNAANDAPEYEVGEKDGVQILKKDGEVVTRTSPLDDFCTMVHDWMDDLVNEGVTEEMIDELNTVLADFRFYHVMIPSKNGTPHWQTNIADLNRHIRTEEAAGYAFAHLLAIGGLKGLKRCQLSDCKKFFIGRPNSKWCSKSCGSKFRVRRKRKQDLG